MAPKLLNLVLFFVKTYILSACYVEGTLIKSNTNCGQPSLTMLCVVHLPYVTGGFPRLDPRIFQTWQLDLFALAHN